MTRERGFTYLEMVATAGILAILASAIMPLARVTRTRQKEIELRRELRVLRTAIDEYKKKVDQGQIGGSDVRLGSEGYPPDLDTLVEGVNQVGRLDFKLKFLRRIPVDPMTGKAEWGEGVVTGAQPATQDGKPCQRVTVRFDRAGIKTLSTALAPLQHVQDRPEIESALATAGSDWLSNVGSKQVQEIMTRLPERATDPFAAAEGLYRLGRR